MKKLAIIVIILATALLISVSGLKAEDPPPMDDMELLPDLGIDTAPGEQEDPYFSVGPGPRVKAGGRNRQYSVGPDGFQKGRHGKGQGRQKNMERLKTEDPKRYQRLEKIKELAKKYRDSTSEKEKQNIEKEIKPLVEEELKAQQKKQKTKIEKMEKRLKEAKNILKQREENWDEVVDYTVKEVTGQNNYLKAWRPAKNRK
jgi:hypothetical protein